MNPDRLTLLNSRPSTALSGAQSVSLHTYTGVQLYRFLPGDEFQSEWTRTLRDVSTCQVGVPYNAANGIPDITPLLHWISVWDDDDRLLWTGPMVKPTFSRDRMQLGALDLGFLLAGTRVPLTKRWDAADPAVIADDLWRAMIDHHGVGTRPVVRTDPLGSPFDFDVKADSAMLDATMGELVQRGLRWSVVAGTPILGPMPLEPVTTLDADIDFVGADPQIVRDGSKSFNDVVLRGGDAEVRGRVPMGGLNIQKIVTVDSIFGVGNANRALQQFLRDSAGIRDALVMPPGSQLAPDAPLTLQDLVPSARFVVSAYGMRALMELEAVTVSASSGEASVAVTLESVRDDAPELAKLVEKAAGS